MSLFFIAPDANLRACLLCSDWRMVVRLPARWSLLKLNETALSQRGKIGKINSCGSPNELRLCLPNTKTILAIP
jgi:hypothetical protein